MRMAAVTRWSTAMLAGFICLLHTSVMADTNNNYHIATLCHRKRSQQLYKTIDGAVLTSNNENNLDCVITFQTDSVLQKFMLRFEQLQLDCNANLYIYDGAHAFGSYKAKYSCGNNERDVAPIFTSTTSVTLKYVTDGWVPVGNAFRLVLTAFKDSPLECRGYRCQNHLCIHEDLTCDRVNHCGDKSDESSTLAYCIDDEMAGTILGVGIGIFVVIIVGTFIACFVCVSGAAIFIYKRYYRRRPPLPNLNSAPNYPYQENNYIASTLRGNNHSTGNSHDHHFLSDILPKVAEESAPSAKTNSTALNSVSVFHSASGGGSPGGAGGLAGGPGRKQPPPVPCKPSRSSNNSPVEPRRSTPPGGQTATLPRSKPPNHHLPSSYSPGGTAERHRNHAAADRIQCGLGQPLLSDEQMKTASLNRANHKKSGSREKGEWLV